MDLIIACVIGEVVFFLIWSFYCYVKCPRTAILITSAEIIVPLIYLVYSIVAPIFFVCEGRSLADKYCYISEDTMKKTCLLYLGIYFLFLLLLFLFNAGKRLSERKSDWIKKYNYESPSIFWDFVALIIIFYYIARIIAAGTAWANMETFDKRASVSSEYIAYLNIFMVAYTNKLVITWIINKEKRTYFYTLRLIIPIIFWIIYLNVTSRRYFLMVLPAIFMSLIAAQGKEKVEKKYLCFGGIAVISLLIMGAKRLSLTLSKSSWIYFLHNMFAEFIYTYYTSCFFVGHNYKLQYGKTYILDTLTQWIPRAIFPNKPLDMSVRFWNMAHTNVAYSFCPIAEGLYNFGWGAILVVPVVLFMYVKMANEFRKYSNVLYLTMVGCFVGFMRGNVSNCLLDYFMITIIMVFMNIRGKTYVIYMRKDAS